MINETLDKQIKLNNKIRELEDKLSLIQRAREDKLNITDKSETFEAQLIQLENEFNKALKSLYEETKDNKVKQEKSVVCGAYRISTATDKVEIIDSALITDDYKIEKVSKARDDKKIKEALASGEKLSFARLVKDISIKDISRKTQEEQE